MAKTFLLRLKVVAGLAVLLTAQVPIPAEAALAWTADPSNNPDTNTKSYVCKTTGRPGQNEALQTGNNPIQVNRESTDVVGTSFNDAQGGSYIVGFGYPSEPQDQQPTLGDCVRLASVTPQLSQVCSDGRTASGSISVIVTNNDGIIGNTVEYTVTVGTQTQTTTPLADGVHQTLTFTGLVAANYSVTISAYGQTVYRGSQAVGVCEVTTTPATAVNGAFSDTCGTAFNLLFTPAVTAGVTYNVTTSGNTTTVTATAKPGYVLTNPSWTQSATDALVPCITRCVESTGSEHVTTKEQFATATPLNAQGADGHYEFTADGLHIWTTIGDSTSKIAWYNAVDNYSLADIGVPSMVYTGTGTAPGMQIAVDIDGNGTYDGMLVGEPASYGNNWWSNRDFGVGAGMEYASYGTLQEYLDANPLARVMAVGFSLGSGVVGDGTLSSLTFGCYTWTFGAKPEVVEPTVPTFTNATCSTMATITIPESDLYGYTISWNGQDEELADPGIYEQRSPSTVVVRAYALDGESLVQAGEWTYVFTSPAGCTPGMGNVTPPATSTNPLTAAVLPMELPETGGLSISGVIVSIAAAAATYGAVYFAQAKRRYE